MKLSFKYRIYPTKAQQKVIQNNFNFCCFLYNSALQERNSYYKKCHKSLSYNKQSAELPEIRKEFKDQVNTIYAQSLQQVLKKLDASYKSFFRRVKQKSGKKAGFPRYKSADRFRSIIFPQADLKTRGVKLLANKKLKVFGLPGELKVKWHRPVQGRCKTVTIKKEADKFYLILSCDEVPLQPLAKTQKTVAIDLGISSFITTDDGTQSHHPKPYKTAKEKLAFLNQKLALKKKGSKNRFKAKSQLAKAYQKVHNIKEDFQHKLSLKLLRENDEIIFEKLNIQNMIKEGHTNLVKSITEASWGSFIQKLTYKAERADKKVTSVDPKNTSKTCSKCLQIKESLSLSEREYHCEACDFAMSRDQNAAINIKRLGLSLAANHSDLPQKSLH
jgi:putative transposase